VLVPVLAELEQAETVEVGGHAHTVDKEASAGIVALRAPDGRTALPVFSSVQAVAAWRADARPVPSEIARAALSAVTEGWELLVLDPGGPVTVLLPRPAVWALAQQQEWRPAVPGLGERRAVDPEVRDAVRSTLSGVPGLLHADRGPVVAVDAEPGRRAEVAVALTLVPGLDRAALDAVLRRVGDALATDETVTRRVDSLEMRLS
jgi:antitoxin (DNA-binding transcriptional repressor) of toxin-antitoxin stability system